MVALRFGRDKPFPTYGDDLEDGLSIEAFAGLGSGESFACQPVDCAIECVALLFVVGRFLAARVDGKK